MSAYGEYYILLLRLPVTIESLKFKTKFEAKLKEKKPRPVKVAVSYNVAGKMGRVWALVLF